MVKVKGQIICFLVNTSPPRLIHLFLGHVEGKKAGICASDYNPVVIVELCPLPSDPLPSEGLGGYIVLVYILSALELSLASA